MYAQPGMRHILKWLFMRTVIWLAFILIFFGCKSKERYVESSGFTFEDTVFDNKESESQTIHSALYSREQERNTLVRFNGKKIPIKTLNSLLSTLDSTYQIDIIRDRITLDKMKIRRKYKTLISIYKSS